MVVGGVAKRVGGGDLGPEPAAAGQPGMEWPVFSLASKPEAHLGVSSWDTSMCILVSRLSFPSPPPTPCTGELSTTRAPPPLLVCLLGSLDISEAWGDPSAWRRGQGWGVGHRRHRHHQACENRMGVFHFLGGPCEVCSQ